MSKVHLGVIGCGFIGQHHLAVAARLDGVAVVAVADADERRAREAAHTFRIPTVHAGAETLLADPNVDAVVLAIPTVGRSQLAAAAFAAGKHVLLEKPPALNAAELRTILAVQGNRVGACCSSRYRLTPMGQAATDFLRTGSLGALRVVRGRWMDAAGPQPMANPPAWRVSHALNGGGILANWGSYDLDFLLGVTGWTLRPERVLAQTWPIAPAVCANVTPDSDAESHGLALIHCAGGVMLSLERAEFSMTNGEDVWEILGTDGTLHIPMAGGLCNTLVHEHYCPNQGVIAETLWQAGTGEGGAGQPVTDFVGAILENRPPQTTLEQALVIQTILDGIYESARTGRAVELDASGR